MQQDFLVFEFCLICLFGYWAWSQIKKLWEHEAALAFWGAQMSDGEEWFFREKCQVFGTVRLFLYQEDRRGTKILDVDTRHPDIDEIEALEIGDSILFEFQKCPLPNMKIRECSYLRLVRVSASMTLE